MNRTRLIVAEHDLQLDASFTFIPEQIRESVPGYTWVATYGRYRRPALVITRQVAVPVPIVLLGAVCSVGEHQEADCNGDNEESYQVLH